MLPAPHLLHRPLFKSYLTTTVTLLALVIVGPSELLSPLGAVVVSFFWVAATVSAVLLTQPNPRARWVAVGSGATILPLQLIDLGTQDFRDPRSGELIYFSLVTVTTLG